MCSGGKGGKAFGSAFRDQSAAATPTNSTTRHNTAGAAQCFFFCLGSAVFESDRGAAGRKARVGRHAARARILGALVASSLVFSNTLIAGEIEGLSRLRRWGWAG